MSAELRHRHYGTPVSEWLEQVANELPRDAVGLWQIVPDGRFGFGLEGDALAEYIRRSIAVLLRRGAVPVVGGGDTDYYWIYQPQYGSRPGEIIESVVREWLSNGARDEDPGGLWFALPDHPGTPNYVLIRSS